MAFTYGFYNSLKGDRKYNAEQVSEIFDGLITDGVISGIGGLFAVTSANNGMQINVATGRAWFDHTWSKNDSIMVLTVPLSDVVQNRYDTVVLEVNHEESIRANSIKIVTGTPAVNPTKPPLVNTERVHQYPLAHILVEAGSSTIKASNIENCVGLAPTVFATGVLKTASLDELWSQWKGQWEEWFAGIKLQLSGDVVTNLQYQIEQLKDQLKELSDMIDVQWVTHVDVISNSSNWQNKTGKNISVTVLVFGGGGGRYSSAGESRSAGGGGHMGRWQGTIPIGASIPVTIGRGGSDGETGGTTSFGSYISANGGSAGDYSKGGNGGTGGGGAGAGNYSRDPSFGAGGGNGSYGGGGGAGGPSANGLYANGGGNYMPFVGYNGSYGGDGGVYGGGGGGSGASGSGSNGGTYAGASGGGGGSSTGGRGRGGSGGASGSVTGNINGATYTPSSAGSSGGSGTNTNSLDIEFKGAGSAGSGGSRGTQMLTGGNPSTTVLNGGGGGGGGGGGYGGNGGRGGNGGNASYHTNWSNYTAGFGGGGGGGGGYGAPGGNGATGVVTNSATTAYAGGGGGGGYGGAGESATATSPGGGGGYGTQNFGKGGGVTDANDGVCIVTYTTKEIIIN